MGEEQDESLRDVVAELRRRVARLETDRPPPAEAVVDLGAAPPERGRIAYSGTGPWDGRSVVWQMERSWDDLTTGDAHGVARVLTALASPIRLRIVGELTVGPASTGDLADGVDAGTSGQLFHHLKELLAAGLVHQPRRGIYALRPQHVLPLLAIWSAASDLAPPSTGSES